MDKLKKLEAADVSAVKVANATTRPNASGFYGGGSLTSEGVKALFDQYPEKLREKLNEVIGFANALLETLGGQGDKITTAEAVINFLRERVGEEEVSKDTRFTSNALASAILKLSTDLGAVEESPFSAEYDHSTGVLRFKTNGNAFSSVDLPLESVFVGADYDDENGNLVLTLVNGSKVSIKNDALISKIEEALFSEELPEAMYNAIVTEGGLRVTLLDGKLKFTGGGSGGGGGTTVKINGEAVSEFDADTKLDKISSTSGATRCYVIKPDGTQGLSEIGVGAHRIASRNGTGDIMLPSTIGSGSPYFAVHRQYVNDAIALRMGDIQSALEELHTYAQSLIGGNEE